MNIGIVVSLLRCGAVLATSQSNDTILIHENSHWAYYRGNQHINSKVVLMASVQGRSLNILLHDVTVFRFCHLLSEKLVPLALSLGTGVLLLHFDALLHLQVLFHLEPSSFGLSIESHSHLLDFAANEDTTTLTTGFGFANSGGQRQGQAPGRRGTAAHCSTRLDG